VSAALSEVDADATLSITSPRVPAGASCTAGTDNGGCSWTLTPLQLAGLTLTSDGETQHFDLTVTATTTDGASTAPTAGSIHVDRSEERRVGKEYRDSGSGGDQNRSTHAGKAETSTSLE